MCFALCEAQALFSLIAITVTMLAQNSKLILMLHGLFVLHSFSQERHIGHMTLIISFDFFLKMFPFGILAYSNFFFYLVACLSSYHEKAINAPYELA